MPRPDRGPTPATPGSRQAGAAATASAPAPGLHVVPEAEDVPPRLHDLDDPAGEDLKRRANRDAALGERARRRRAASGIPGADRLGLTLFDQTLPILVECAIVGAFGLVMLGIAVRNFQKRD